MELAAHKSQIKPGLHIVVGASPNPNRYSYIATSLLSKYGYEVHAFGIRKGMIDKVGIENSLPEGEIVDTVTLYLNPERQKSYVLDIIKLKPKRVIFNPGTESETSKHLFTQSGIECIEACTLVMLRTAQY